MDNVQKGKTLTGRSLQNHAILLGKMAAGYDSTIPVYCMKLAVVRRLLTFLHDGRFDYELSKYTCCEVEDVK